MNKTIYNMDDLTSIDILGKHPHIHFSYDKEFDVFIYNGGAGKPTYEKDEIQKTFNNTLIVENNTIYTIPKVILNFNHTEPYTRIFNSTEKANEWANYISSTYLKNKLVVED